MLTIIENVLSAEEVQQFRAQLDNAPWRDGAATAGSLARLVKHNQQLDDSSDLAVTLGNHIVRRLGGHPTFIAAALPREIYPPKFNRYQDGGGYGLHIDSAVMPLPNTRKNLRSDLACTLFLSDPDDYDGGELDIETGFGAQTVKLAAGDLVLYPASSLHRVTPVTRGARIAAFMWVESLVADASDRATLYDLDRAIQALTPRLGAQDHTLLTLTGVYHNLLRRSVIT